MTANTAQKIYGSFKAKAAHGEETGVKKNDIFGIPANQLLEEEGFNERDFNDPEVIAKVEEFAKAYTNGQPVPPLMVRIDSATGNFYIVEGHTRVRGAKLAISRGVNVAPLQCIPFRGNDMDRLHCQLDSQSGLPLKPVGVARNYLKLINLGATEAEIAERRNKTLTHVQGMLLLAGAATEVQRMVNNNEVSATQAIEIIRQHGDGAAKFLREKLQEAKEKGNKKIKPSAVREWFPPKKIAKGVIGSVQGLVSSLDVNKRRQLAELENLEPEQLQGKTLEVDAALVLALVKSWGVATDAREKKEKAQQAAQLKKSQQPLPGTED